MQISYYCDLTDLNWSVVAGLPARLKELGMEVKEVEADLSWYPESQKLNSLEGVPDLVKLKGSPRTYSIDLNGGEYGKKSHFSLSIWHGWNVHGEEFLTCKLNAPSPEKPLLSAMEFLGLRPESPSAPTPKSLPRTVFIAHRFDDAGQEAADKLARFLSLLGFDCQTGRGYAPGSVAEKVKARLTGQAIVVAIMTPGDDATWLTQESILGSVAGKPLIVLKESKVAFKSGLLADHEYIPFTGRHIEQTFIPLLEGLIELKYNFKQ
jgi:hypothetical protein